MDKTMALAANLLAWQRSWPKQLSCTTVALFETQPTAPKAYGLWLAHLDTHAGPHVRFAGAGGSRLARCEGAAAARQRAAVGIGAPADGFTAAKAWAGGYEHHDEARVSARDQHGAAQLPRAEPVCTGALCRRR